MAKRYDDDFKAKMVELYKQGMSVKDICKEHSMTTATLNRWVRSTNLTLNEELTGEDMSTEILTNLMNGIDFSISNSEPKPYSKFDFFWNTMELCDYSKYDNIEILQPVIDHLATLEDEKIYDFDSIMSKLLYDIDSVELFKACQKMWKYVPDDHFLYNRCCVLIQGKEIYHAVNKGEFGDNLDGDFMDILDVPKLSWEKKHNNTNYKFTPKYDYVTGSNSDNWNAKDIRSLT